MPTWPPAASDVRALRTRLQASGFVPVALYSPDQDVTVGGQPILPESRGKVPVGAGWQNGKLTPFDPKALNTGILANGLQAFDIDVDNAELARDIRQRIIARFGEAPMRTRATSSRCLLVYRATPGMQPAKKAVSGPLGKLEVLGRGQQFHAFGLHYSGAMLEWMPEAPGDVRAADLPVARFEDVAELLAEIAPLLGVAEPESGKPGKAAKANGWHPPSPLGPTADFFAIAAAVNDLPNDGAPDWEAWNKAGMALWAATSGSEAGRELWRGWSKRHPLYDAAMTEERWNHYPASPPQGVGAGMLFHMAKQARADRAADQPQAGPETPAGEAERPTALFNPWDALQPPEFPIDALPDVIRAFVEDRARVLGADPCALAWAALSACSAALDGRIRLRMKQHDGWSVPPHLWLALVGAPSTRKTAILDTAWAPLRAAQAADVRAWKIEHDQWKALPRKERADTPEPYCRRRLITDSATIEAIEAILGRQDRGIAVFCDELTSWLGALEKYSQQRGSTADRAFFLQAYNGGAYVSDRIGRGTTPVGNLGVTIAGGIQPDRLRQLGDMTADGLWQRFLPIITAPAPIGRDEPSGDKVADYAVLIDRLLHVDAQTVVVLSDPVRAMRVDVEARLDEIEQSGALGPAFAAFCGKLQGVWGRLCLVLSQIEPDAAPHVVAERTAFRASRLLFKCLLPNAARIYAAMGGAGTDIEATRSVAGYILTKRRTRVLASDLSRNVRACRGLPLEEVQRLVSPLVAGGWLAPEREFNPISWAVNAAVHRQFTARAATETARRTAVRALIAGHLAEDEADVE
jgi:hypothetical protein